MPSTPPFSLPADAVFVALGLPGAVIADHAAGRRITECPPEDFGAGDVPQGPGDLVGCLLFGPGMDASDVLRVLAAGGFRGTALVIAPPLPNPAMVQRELAALARGFALRLVTAPPV